MDIIRVRLFETYPRFFIFIFLIVSAVSITLLVNYIKSEEDKRTLDLIRIALAEELGKDAPQPTKTIKLRKILSLLLAILIIFTSFLTGLATNIIFTPIEQRIMLAESEIAGGTNVDSLMELEGSNLLYDLAKEKSRWSNEGERRDFYTLEEINDPDFIDKVDFNIITDSTIGHEARFVSARIDTGKNDGEENVWFTNDIWAYDGTKYIVRLYAHNCSKLGYDAIAKEVRVRFILPNISENRITVEGIIYCSNSEHSWYSDTVNFISDQPFHLEYIPGSATFWNNTIGLGGCSLSEDVFADKGTYIGYDKLDGIIPGCYQYASYSTIKVRVVYD